MTPAVELNTQFKSVLTMKLYLFQYPLLAILTLVVSNILFMTPSFSENSSSLYDLEVRDLAGNDVKLESFRGKVALVVNTASNCGFTSQYADLENIYQRYRDRGFVVLAFPSNDFGGQEPGSNEEIAAFCEGTYGISFPVFEKGPVSGNTKQPVYDFLTRLSKSDFQGDPGWNFVKFLVDQEGIVQDRFPSLTKPTSEKITGRIEQLLKQ